MKRFSKLRLDYRSQQLYLVSFFFLMILILLQLITNLSLKECSVSAEASAPGAVLETEAGVSRTRGSVDVVFWDSL